MKRILVLIVILTSYASLFAHGRYDEHCREMIAVFGFERNDKLYQWAKFISSDMIDKRDFYYAFKERHPGFTCKHRLMFHWGYNNRPWNSDLERKTIIYCDKVNAKNVSDTIALFKQEMVNEQRRRNRLINAKTEKLFGFANGGTDGMLANRFASMAYNIHILGDYTSDNSDLDGLLDINNLIGAIVTDINTLDKERGKPLVKGITLINKKYSDPQQKADALMAYLLKEFPMFVKEMRNGSVYNRLKRKGFHFIK